MSDHSKGPILHVPEPGFQLSRRLAVSFSLGLHAVVLYAVSHAPRPEAEIIEATTPPVVWLSRTTPREPPLPELLPPLPPPTELREASESAEFSPAEDAEAPTIADGAEPAANGAARTPTDEVPEPAAETNGTSIADLPSTEVDWQAESRRAIENVLDAIEADQDFVVVQREAGRGLSSGPRRPKGTFEPGSSVSGPRLLTPNKSNSVFVQRLARLCNELSGGGLGMGFSFFGLAGISGTVCAEGDARRDLFASAKPEYLKKLPDCREVAINTDAFIDGDLPEELSAIKCRLVYKDELAEGALAD